MKNNLRNRGPLPLSTNVDTTEVFACKDIRYSVKNIRLT